MQYAVVCLSCCCVAGISNSERRSPTDWRPGGRKHPKPCCGFEEIERLTLNMMRKAGITARPHAHSLSFWCCHEARRSRLYPDLRPGRSMYRIRRPLVRWKCFKCSPTSMCWMPVPRREGKPQCWRIRCEPGISNMRILFPLPAGRLVAGESQPHRLQRLRENMTRLQLDWVHCRELDAARPFRELQENSTLCCSMSPAPTPACCVVDPMCGGVLPRTACRKWSGLQAGILAGSIRTLKPGGRLVLQHMQH